MENALVTRTQCDDVSVAGTFVFVVLIIASTLLEFKENFEEAASFFDNKIL